MPNKSAQRPAHGWETISASELCRHNDRVGHLTKILMNSENMRCKWHDFLPAWCFKLKRDRRNPDTTPRDEQFLFSGPDCPSRHESALKMLINNAGHKPRFRARWSAEARALLDQVVTFSIAWFKIVNSHPPLEIMCIQGGSGGMDLNEDECFALPPGWKRVYHGTYLHKLEGILSDGTGLRCGGTQGVAHRSRIYASALNYLRFKLNYRSPSSPWVKFRYEPYHPRWDTNCMVILSVPTCRETGCNWCRQNPMLWSAPVIGVRLFLALSRQSGTMGGYTMIALRRLNL